MKLKHKWQSQWSHLYSRMLIFLFLTILTPARQPGSAYWSNTYLFRAELMRSLHKVSTDHGERDTVSVVYPPPPRPLRPYKVNSMFCVLRFPKTYQPAREKNTHNKKHTRHKYDTTRRILYKNNQFTNISLLQIAQLYENRIYNL